MKNGGVQLVINTTEGAKAISDSRDIRRAALLGKIPYYTTIPGADRRRRRHHRLPQRQPHGPPGAGLFRGLKRTRRDGRLPHPGAEVKP